jgi:ferritin-like metal-binding protein YciE
VFESLGQKARGKHCAGIAGIIEEGEEVFEKAESPEVRDAMLIAGAQKVEHGQQASEEACYRSNVLQRKSRGRGRRVRGRKRSRN